MAIAQSLIKRIAGIQSGISVAVANYLIEHPPAGYTHPSTHPATMITEDDIHKFTTDIEKGMWNGKEPANSNIQTHVTSAHAPSNAQANADITKAEIEAKLIGEISSHTHAGGGGGLTQQQIEGMI